ncbi:DNA cytosine methyltransferase [Aeromonas veronii]|uniref:DNA (cytosine-5-)-methyltransferase n=1 Tax=Aeromonas veronii TaxID=654 RepID=UPI002090734A|nr:DNA cytosine methyltransferase [Aeromonas veronii]MCO5341105.1 DNA cytosine methyltransferase [Aeromonas veronii]
MIYGSVCSGVEAASLAWEPLGWNPAWFAEIEPFPSAVLAHHWPHVTNLGDMTKIATAVLKGDVVAPDILVGGTPCQAFSVAGAREGLADDRGFLTIKYVELANAIDQKRAAAGAVPCITVWENVPGVLSSKDNAFGAFLGFLAGEDCELVPPGKKWENAGCVLGPQRAIAWRILDAQYFGVAQRRRRVFVVASAREGFDPAKVLFECEGVRRDSAPSREAGKAVATLTANGIGTCGADDNQGQAGHLIPLATSTGHISHCLNAGGMGRIDYETETVVVHGTQDPDTNTELAHTLGRNHEQENAVLTKYNSIKDHDQRVIFAANNWDELVRENQPCVTGDITHTLKTEGFDASEDGTGRGHPIVPAAYTKEPTPINLQVIVRHESLGRATGFGLGEPGEAAYTLGANHMHEIWHGMAVRRLTPVECERLQGFPDGHTDVPYRGKPAADGPRYKAIGNSMAVPCMAFIGRRIDLHLSEIDLPAVDEEAA